MKAYEIRAELEKWAETGPVDQEAWDQLSNKWEAVRATTPASYHPVIDDRLQASKPQQPDKTTGDMASLPPEFWQKQR
ncbi:MAG: hypothetical protein AAFR99_11475 [Cyanobacteria bacterium J06629_9]